ncbi:RHS domain-containing protein [Burkholderia aenigmatica]|uniref:RHS domain-containing protein n=1 Tax=Burkholderia aenigmatica TaxID=2015348 RepID=UPI003C6C24B6
MDSDSDILNLSIGNHSDCLSEDDYLHNDVSGLPDEQTDADVELSWQARYEVWSSTLPEAWIAWALQPANAGVGDVRAATPVPTNVQRAHNPRFPGEHLDCEKGLQQGQALRSGHRALINPAPIWFTGKTSPYRYMLNPISWTDPFGLSPCSTNSTSRSFEDRMARSRGKARCASEMRKEERAKLSRDSEKQVREANRESWL